ncbi:hypothetical protein ABVV53_10765 [Novosphingobium sp. RD2P27]|uniref:HTH crp-type domain-containing protein n=1 Tax=Novosphingobium kalidii TaxID=3230299 RepID=A0ABV2D263_9SPHN
MTPETLSRALQIVREHGLVLRGRKVILNDRAKVQEFCKPSPLRDGGEANLYVRAW